MSKPVSKKMVGIFVVVGIALLVVAVLILGSGKFFKTLPKYVMFFQGSVKGLSVGSPVVFRGVKIGTVSEISVYFDPKTLAFFIPVYVELEAGSIIQVKGTEASTVGGLQGDYRKVLMTQLIQRGLRAQLEMQSIVTGQLQVALDFYQDKPATLVGAEKRYPEIPTIPTTFQEISQKLSEIPFKEIADEMKGTLTAINRLVSSPEMGRLVRSLAEGADEAKTLMKDINRQVAPLASQIGDTTQEIKKLAAETRERLGPLAQSLTKASDKATAALERIQSTMGNIETMTGSDSAIAYRLTKALEELELAARSMRTLMDTMEQQPESVIFGKKNTGGK
jgi:paraquat-inducible protein B